MTKAYTDNKTLWTAFKQGEYGAEKQVFEQFFKPLCVYAERITGELAAAEDIVAETFTKTWSTRQQFENLDNAKAFLYRVTRNASINFAVANRAHRNAHSKIEYMAKQDVQDESALEREMLRVELLQEIYEEMENLPDRCGQVFKLIFLHGKSTEEIGELLGINPQTVRTQKARAILLIKTQLLKKNRLAALVFLTAMIGSWTQR